MFFSKSELAAIVVTLKQKHQQKGAKIYANNLVISSVVVI